MFEIPLTMLRGVQPIIAALCAIFLGCALFHFSILPADEQPVLTDITALGAFAEETVLPHFLRAFPACALLMLVCVNIIRSGASARPVADVVAGALIAPAAKVVSFLVILVWRMALWFANEGPDAMPFISQSTIDTLAFGWAALRQTAPELLLAGAFGGVIYWMIAGFVRAAPVPALHERTS